MNTKRFLILMAAVAVVLLVGGSVYADDGRMNPAPFHFGGDSLFCNAGSGCTLVNQTDQTLATWKQSEVDAALSLTDNTGANAQVGKDGQGTFGVAQLWSVKADASLGKRQLCLVGYDEWGKQNSMCFLVNKDFVYERAPIGIGNDSCSWNLVALHATWNDGNGNFYETGWVIAQITAQGQIVVDSLYWMDTDPGYKACPWSEK